MAASSQRKVLQEITIEPGTGKALELRRGQVLRIEQTVGHQCADFNCFNLHDYKEFFHTGRTRHLHGLHPTKGAFLWSAPPRERPMMAIIEDTVGTNDILYPRCSGFLFEHQYGLPVHTNCHDIQAEAQREYGLTPDDVHDSFNFFMHTGVNAGGHPFIAENTAREGDYVELLALMDVLAVPNVCGADVMKTSDFELKPLKLAVFEGTDEDWKGIPEFPKLRNQRSPADFKVKSIKADRELYRDPSYQPEFVNVPLTVSELEVKLSPAEMAWVGELKATGKYGNADAEVLRYVFFAWWIARFMRGPKHASP
ncbi:urea carboxylase-associated family protein [Bradyrhizobium sp. BRP22]|uniref:DUF1989 domain-containing protein n=1 Tax=Bradyrhizobium sp. BRP22 TaxID=2793821 RepID=UPI001CD6099E|nr:urea carboxylase-associated family protein [Bradyrhizobium sp. BRP22]MCA1453589.1 urea carboxylase-associated family protein [Bradyrhizobium sp. BRP22]